MSDLRQLRTDAISQSLFPPTTLKAAIHRLGFIQADPIRSPARAQDLILRHRVRSYRAGDLDRRYPSLDIEEDVLYAYGFLPRPMWQLLHPRNLRGMSKLEKKVLETVSKFGVMHPTELQEHFGGARVINAWGSYSKATTQRPNSKRPAVEFPRVVRFLAPFDPLVWDRQRFEHFWCWPYRFEAYTPPAKRVRGYYSMPLLWCDAVIGWANARVEDSRVIVEVGFVNKAPADSDFERELKAEIARLQTFLGLNSSQ